MHEVMIKNYVDFPYINITVCASYLKSPTPNPQTEAIIIAQKLISVTHRSFQIVSEQMMTTQISAPKSF